MDEDSPGAFLAVAAMFSLEDRDKGHVDWGGAEDNEIFKLSP